MENIYTISRLIASVLGIIGTILLIRVLILTIITKRNPVYIKYKKQLDEIKYNIGLRVYRTAESSLATFNSHTRSSDYLLNYTVKNNYAWFEKELQILEDLNKRCNIDMFDVRSELANQHKYVIGGVEDLISEIMEYKYLLISVTYRSPGGRSQYTKGYKYTVDQLKNVLNKIKESEYKVSSYNTERSKLTSKLRYKILNKFSYTCQYCGATIKDGAKLHVDHIIPISKGGLTEEDNLTIACQDCNLGKSNIVY